MRDFTYIDENNEETIDLIRLFEYAFNLDTNEIVKGLKELDNYVLIKDIYNGRYIDLTNEDS